MWLIQENGGPEGWILETHVADEVGIDNRVLVSHFIHISWMG